MQLHFLPGNIAVELTSADISTLLNKLASEGIRLQSIRCCDDFTVCVTVRRQYFQQLLVVVRKQGAVANF